MYEYYAPMVTQRTVKFDGVHTALVQTFTYTTAYNTGVQQATVQTTVYSSNGSTNLGTFKTVYNYAVTSFPFSDPDDQVIVASPTPMEQTIQYYDYGQTNLLETVTKGWQDQFRLGCQLETHDGTGLKGTFYSYGPGLSLTAEEEYDYGQISSTSKCPQSPEGGPITAPAGWTRQTATTYQAFASTSISDRPCRVITYDSSGTNRVAETDYFYDNGSAGTPCGTAGTPSVTGVSNLTGHDETNYGPSSTTPRGNLTQKTQWLNTGTSPATTYTYDETGQVLSMTDPNTNRTSYSYADSFLNTNSAGFTTTAGSPPTGKVTNAYLTKVTQPATNGYAHIEGYSYGYNDGELTQSSDQNSPPNLTTYRYNDSLSRLTETDYPDTGQTILSYNDSTPSVTTCQLINGTAGATCSPTSPPAGWKTTLSTMDGLGHVVQTKLVSDPDGPAYTVTTYDGTGKSYQVYNPTRCSPPTTNCGTETTWGYATYTYDALGRPKTVAEADGSTATTAYSANQTTVTDETGNQRTSQVDALGRMTMVLEAPNAPGYNFETDYAYDPLNNLLSVNQKGGSTSSTNWRTRTFTYDSLARLLCAANPEVQIVTCPASATGTFPTGAITYQYDANSNLTAKVAPKPNQTGTLQTTTSYSYDALNRLYQKSYSDPYSGAVLYGYDGKALTCASVNPPTISSPTNLIGRRSSMCAGPSASSWSYDPMGRAIIEARYNKGSSSAKKYNVSYGYFKDGSLNTLTYPSGDLVTYTVGGAGRATLASDPSNSFVGYTGKPATYAPQGSLAGMTNGYTSSFAGIVTSNLYNDRLQPILLSASVSSNAVFSLCYDFHLGVAISNTPCSFSASTTGDNGNVFQIFNNVDSTRNAKYSYDPLNRIAQANTINTSGVNCWGEVYTLDPWGNLYNRSGVSGMGTCATEGLSATPTTQNQLSGIGLLYDAAGNVTNEGNGNTPSYDVENRIATVAGYTYSYDGDGMRMEKSNGSSGTMYWPGLGGEVLTETDLTGTVINEEYVYFNGGRIARIDRPSGTVHYYLSDHLGSASVITDASGNTQETTYYFPYGGLVSSSGGDPNHYKFTGKERDSESGLDYFGARHYASTMGRFMTPDWSEEPDPVPHANLQNPQTLNLYGYVQNNPLSRRDADGHVTCDPDTATWGPNGVTVTAGACHLDALDYLALSYYASRAFYQVQQEQAAQNRQALGQVLKNVDTALVGALGIKCSCDPDDKSSGGKKQSDPPKATSPNQMQKQVEAGQAPNSVDRVDSPRFPYEKPHIEFNDGNALNNDGTWKHGGRELTNTEKDWITNNGWSLPK